MLLKIFFISSNLINFTGSFSVSSFSLLSFFSTSCTLFLRSFLGFFSLSLLFIFTFLFLVLFTFSFFWLCLSLAVFLFSCLLELLEFCFSFIFLLLFFLLLFSIIFSFCFTSFLLLSLVLSFFSKASSTFLLFNFEELSSVLFLVDFVVLVFVEAFGLPFAFLEVVLFPFFPDLFTFLVVSLLIFLLFVSSTLISSFFSTLFSFFTSLLGLFFPPI